MVNPGVRELPIRIVLRPPSKTRRLPRNRFVVTTKEGLELVEKWFHAPKIPSELARTYQMLLQLIWNGGSLKADIASRLWHRDVLAEALKNRYIRLTQSTEGLPLEVQERISEMVDRPSGEYYV